MEEEVEEMIYQKKEKAVNRLEELKYNRKERFLELKEGNRRL